MGSNSPLHSNTKAHLELSTQNCPISQLTSSLFCTVSRFASADSVPVCFFFLKRQEKLLSKSSFIPVIFKLIILNIGGVFLLLYCILELVPNRCCDESAVAKQTLSLGGQDPERRTLAKVCARRRSFLSTQALP